MELVTMPDLSTGQQGTGVVHVIKLQLDVNHDGVMDLSWSGPDNTSGGHPFRFWVNNDYDGISNGNEIDVQKIHDFSDGKIDSQRDMEDFARLWLSGVPALPSGQGYTVTLEILPISGDPRIKLYPAVETNGGIGYLTNTTTAALQMTISIGQPSPGQALGEVAEDLPLTLPASSFTEAGNKYFLFEGSGEGIGQLVLTIWHDGERVAWHQQILDLRDIKEMYEQALAYNVTSGLPPSSLVSEVQVQRAQAPTPDETKQVVVFVHGINNTEFEYARSTETMFKRLYWSGYRGKVAGFRWPCAYLANEPLINPAEWLKAFNYNKGEFYAFKSANAFKDYLTWLSTRPELDGYTINILAHSQGNIVASEALLQGAPFDNYILSQGAVPAHSYDTSTNNVPFLTKFTDKESTSPTPLQTAQGGYHGYFAGLSGNLVNFFNPQDYALATGTTTILTWPFVVDTNWEANQLSRKPENFVYLLAQEYYYVPETQLSHAYYSINNVQTVTDPHEIMSMVARSRTAAVGAHAGVNGPLNATVDLQTTFGFGNTRDEHSAQFTRMIQSAWPYFDEMIVRFQMTLNVTR